MCTPETNIIMYVNCNWKIKEKWFNKKSPNTWPNYILSIRDSPETQRQQEWKWKHGETHPIKKIKTEQVATLTSDKMDFKSKKVTRVKEGYDTLIKGLIQQ